MSSLNAERIVEVINTEQAQELLYDLTSRIPATTARTNAAHIEFRAFPEAPVVKDTGLDPKRHWLALASVGPDSIEAAINWCRERALEGYGVYVGFNPRKGKEKGDKASVAQNVALYADCDTYKTPGASNEAVISRALALAVPPTYIVNSGGGVQLIWIVNELPVDKWEAAQFAIFNAFKDQGADTSVVTDTARVLRVPGFPNQKKADGPRPTSLPITGSTDGNPYTPLQVDILVGELKQLWFENNNLGDSDEEEVVTVDGVVSKPKLQVPDQIAAGGNDNVAFAGRNDLLFKLAASLRSTGLNSTEIDATLQTVNLQRCTPPLSAEEVRSISRSATRYEMTNPITASVEDVVAATPEANISLGVPYGLFRTMTFAKKEPVLYGLNRGEVGMIQARPNVGKTTLGLNLSLSMASGRAFEPIFPGGQPLRVFYVDKENTPGFVQDDMEKMVSRNFDDVEQSMIEENFFPAIDPMIDDKTEFAISNPMHLALLEERLKLFKPDLVIFDTLAACAALANENDNSEMEQKVCKPLKDIARKINCAILVIHHIGKMSESADNQKLYRGRGASSLAAMVRLVLDLDALKDTNKCVIDGHVVLNCAKIKGQRFEDVTYKLNFANRWFEVTDVEAAHVDDTLSQLLEVVIGPMSRADIITVMKDSFDKAERTTDGALKSAIGAGYIRKSGRGQYEPTEKANDFIAGKLGGGDDGEEKVTANLVKAPQVDPDLPWETQETTTEEEVTVSDNVVEGDFGGKKKRTKKGR